MSKTVPVKIWDLPTRLFHWSLVAGFGFMWASAELGGLWMDWHAWAGELMLSLILFRLVWGFVGSETSRFSFFIKSPAHAIAHLRELTGTGSGYHLGHNPLGAFMVVLLLLAVLVQAVTGLFITDDIMVEGPLYGLLPGGVTDKLTSIHHLLFNILLLLVVLHISAIVFYRLRKKTNLITAMVVGKANWPANEPVPVAPKYVSAWSALGIFVGCYALVYVSLQWLGS